MKTALRGAFLTAALAAGGCALTGTAPGGPLHAGTATEIQPSWAIAYGPGSATVGGARMSGNAESYGGTKMELVPIPMRIGLRQSLGSAVEVSGDIGWLDSGVEVRAGTPGGSGAFPIAIAAGLRRGPFPFDVGEKTLSGHARFEIYPDVSRANDGSLRLTLAAGLGVGSFTHSLTLPESDRSTGGDAPNFGPFGAIVVRPETRIELGVGIRLFGPHGGIGATLLPWIVVAHGAPTRATCSDCAVDATPSDYSQSWGLSLVITPTAWADLIRLLLGG
ncbi:MAG TPA: hypothetical protein VN962_01830 [Polyangia bacterium]|nr:hypothetical protein [Polyangia bacterium]